MALYIVYRNNPYGIRHGTYMESFDGECIKAEVKMEGNRAVVARNVGVYLPLRQMRPFMLRIQKAGLDK